MSPIAEFWELCASAKGKLDATFNAPDLVPYGAQVVELISSHPQLRSEFGHALVEAAVDGNRCDPWVVEFCVHALRWPELQDRFLQLHVEAKRPNNWTKEPIFGHILEAFDPSWENAQDFYYSYFGSRKPNKAIEPTR